MSTEGGSNVIHVDKSDARLTDDEGIGRRGYDSVRNIWLEVDDAGVSEIEVVSPPSYNRVRLDSLMASLLKEGKKSFTHLLKTVTLASGWVVNES